MPLSICTGRGSLTFFWAGAAASRGIARRQTMAAREGKNFMVSVYAGRSGERKAEFSRDRNRARVFRWACPWLFSSPRQTFARERLPWCVPLPPTVGISVRHAQTVPGAIGPCRRDQQMAAASVAERARERRQVRGQLSTWLDSTDIRLRWSWKVCAPWGYFTPFSANGRG